MSEAKHIWEVNQYPPSFYQPTVIEALNSIITENRYGGKAVSESDPQSDSTEDTVVEVAGAPQQGDSTTGTVAEVSDASLHSHSTKDTISEGDYNGLEFVKTTPLRNRSLVLIQYHGKISEC